MSREFTSGEIDWNDVSATKEKRPSDFMRLKEGENVVRVMSNPIRTYVHWITAQDGSSKKILSPTGNQPLVKRLEEAGFRIQPSYLIKVLDRSDNEFRVLEVGSQIFKGLQTLINNPKWGKATAYDISVNKGPKGTQPLYTVTPNPKEALESNLKQKFVDFNDRINLDKITSPLPDEEICKLLGWSSGDDEEEDFAQASQQKTASPGKSSKFNFDFD